MATLRLKFPEKNESSTLVLSGSRVTLGRLPLNTIQIIDRTLSGFHAEFVLEEDHYRLHDRGSTNGTFVNGETVTDFHLREACKISFGSLECDYNPESTNPADSAHLEALPTRSEINAVQQENVALKARVESLSSEIESLKKAPRPEPAAGMIEVSKDDYEKLLAERDSLKETQRTTAEEITRLKSELGQLQRDRESLQRVADDAKAEIATLNAEPPPAPAPTPEPAAAAPVAAAPELPFAAPPAAAPRELPKPSLPLPTARPAPKPPTSLPGAPARLPIATSPAPTPIARPIATAPGLKPIPRPIPKAPTSAMKGGTQKMDAETAVKPIAPLEKTPPKPPVKLPVQPTVRLQPGQKPSLPGND